MVDNKACCLFERTSTGGNCFEKMLFGYIRGSTGDHYVPKPDNPIQSTAQTLNIRWITVLQYELAQSFPPNEAQSLLYALDHYPYDFWM